MDEIYKVFFAQIISPMESSSTNSAFIFIAGILSSTFATYVGHWLIYRRDLKKYEQDQTIQRKNFIHSDRMIYKNDLNKILEEAYGIIFIFEHYVSLTKSVMDSSRKLSTEEFDNNYRQESEQLARLKSIIFAKFPDCIDYANQIAGHHNNYWGHQRILLLADIENNSEGYRFELGEVIRISNEMSKSAQYLVLKMQEFSKTINNDSTLYE